MKKRPRLFLPVIALLLIAVGWIVFSGKTASPSVEKSPGKTRTERPTELPAPPAPEEAGSDALVAGEPGIKVQESPKPEMAFVRKTISSRWIDSPEKLAGRQRIRIVEADFKYPFLRLEESVTTDPATGQEIVSLLRSSVADHLMVGIAVGADEKAARRIIEANGYRVRAVEPGSYILAELADFSDPLAHEKAIADLAALDEFIDFAEPDYIVQTCLAPNDPAYSSGKLWGLHNPGTTAGSKLDADIDAPEAWQVRSGAPGIVVAVTDTGIQYNHEDLRDNMWAHPVSGSHGFDAYDDDDDPMDEGGHGTHCAGTIGGVGNNAIGMTGVAWEVQLMGVRFLGPNGGSTSDAIRVVNYARLNGAHIISASWGGGGFSQGLFNAILACQEAGIPFVAAAGNSSTNNDSTPHYPSSYNLPNVVSVASTTIGDALSTFSCYGKNSVDIGAPGSSIWSAYIGSNNAYKHLNGTSMATPHVSGALALAMAQFPLESSAKIIARLYDSADRIPALTGKVSTNGRLNLHGLLTGVSTPKDNDNFADAYRFGDSYGFWSGSSQDASKEADEDSFSVPGSGVHSLWFAFRTTNGGLVTLDAYSNISGYRMIVFEGSQKGALRLLYDKPNGAFTFQTIHTFEAKPDTEYRVAFDDRRPNGQMYALRYSLSPPNDFFSEATVATGGTFFLEGTNRGATQENFEQGIPHAGTGRGKSVWWRWTAPVDMDFTINTMGSDFDTVLAVYSGGNARDLTEIASNDDRNALDWTSQVGFQAIAGTTYHIAVDGYRDDAAGEIQLNGFPSGQLTIIRQPQDLTVETGRRAVFDVSVLSGGDPLYQWFFNDAAIPGQTSANLVIDPVGSGDFGNYKVEVRNSENIVTSEVATLVEKQTPPSLAWSSGNQAVASGTAVSIAANFSGSLPMTFAWTKNGQPHPGDSASLAFASAQVADAGAYRLTATNAAGSATADFTLSVVASPWERWEWRRPGIPNAAITDIKVYDGEAFAVSGTMLFRSTDGATWRKSVFPQGFTANSITKSGSLFVCLGLNTDNLFQVATSSNNAVTWTVSTPTGFAVTFAPEKSSVVAFGGAFIAGSSSGYDFFRSTNGIAWTRLSATNLTGQTVNLSGNGRIANNGSKLILASTSSSSSNRLQYFQSTDGISWTERPTQDGTTGQSSSGTPNAACYAMGKFYLFATYSIYSSIDGENWSYHYAPSNGFSNTSLFATNGDTIFAFQADSQTLRYFSNPSDLKFRNLQPAGSHTFTAAATLGTKVLYGTDKGLLGLAADPFGVVIPREKSSTLQSMEFTENLFIARTTNPSYSNIALIDHVSGDGVTWKQNTPLDSLNVVPSGSAFGKYYGTFSYSTAIYSGHNPFDMRSSANDNIGLAPNISFIGQLPNGSALAVSSPATGSSTFHTRAAGATTWSAATFPLTINSASKFAYLGNRWFSNFGSFSSALIYTSTSGTTWTTTGLTGSNPHLLSLGGKSWCVYQSSTFPMTIRAASSTNGTTWTNIATVTGLPGNHYTNYIRRVVAFGDYLVLLGTDENLYFSLDGATWLRGFTPGKVVDIAAGNGQLVAAMKNGGIIQTGAPHPGGSAPLVSIVSPQTASTHLIGSQITIEGTVSDPEEGVAAYDCYMDSVIIASGTGNTFRFTVTTTDPNGHTVTVRARDSQGLRQMDSIRLKVAAAEPENLLANTLGGAVPAKLAVTLDGVFYAAASRSIYRSLDGKSWEKVPIPSFANSIYGMAAGNGSLVIQFDNGAIMTTRDGVNWTHFSPNLTSYWVREPIRFSSGMFIAAYQTQGTITGSVMTSVDGLRWETGTISQEGYLSWTANGTFGTIIGAVAYQYGINRTVDNGYNWIPISPLATGSVYNSHGLFADGRFVVAITSSNGGANKIFVSADSLTWSDQVMPSGLMNTPTLAHIGGIYLLGSSPNFSYISTDAVTWQPMSRSVHHRKITHSRGLFVAEASTGGVITSHDGITWTSVTGPTSAISNILSNDSTYLAIGTDGSVWSSPDGVAWAKTVTGGAPTGIDNRVGLSTAELNGKIVTAGGGLLVTSSNNARSWTNTTVNGIAPSTSTTFAKIVSSGSEMLALAGSYSSANLLHRSTDGVAFTTVSGLPAKTWADLAWSGTEWMLLSTDGSLFRSTNGGITWTQLAVTGMARGAAVAWFNGSWVIIGAETTGSSSPYTGFTLGAGDVLLKNTVIGFYNSIYPVRTIIAHGRLLIWTRGESTFVTSNGTSWAAANLNAGAGNNDYDIYRTSDGFTAFVGSTTAYYPVQAWSAGTTGLTWTAIPSPFNSIQYADNLGDRVFLFTSGSISEFRDKDLALTLPSLTAVTLGVGDQVAARVTIRNLGRAIPPGGAWRVTAWLAKNRFFGDTKNIPLGTFDLTAPMPAPGASAEYDVSFTLPNEILTGNNFLILSLSSANDLVESNTANNTVISATAAINIPQWEFNLATNGNGLVNMDFAATRYPHNARISLTASAGKGAAFTGWAGDANSPNNQITILMDGNKSLQANFSNRANLQLFVRGLGEVTGRADLGTYDVGSTAQLGSQPAEGWTFSHWSGAANSGQPTASILMDAPKTVTAHFVQTRAAWRSSQFSEQQLLDPAISGDQADPDGDDIPNWMERNHGSLATDRNSTGVISVTLDGQFLRCIYTRHTGLPGQASVVCQAGRAMNDWSSPELEERIISTENGIETVEARFPRAGHERGFIRFKHMPEAP